MPPIYDWKCAQCELEAAVLHHHSKSDSPPSEEELNDDKKILKCPDGSEHKWKMIIGKCNFQLIGRGWARDNYE